MLVSLCIGFLLYRLFFSSSKFQCSLPNSTHDHLEVLNLVYKTFDAMVYITDDFLIYISNGLIGTWCILLMIFLIYISNGLIGSADV